MEMEHGPIVDRKALRAVEPGEPARERAVLVEAMAGDSTSPERSGSLALYDAATGRVVKSVTDSRTKSLSFLALSPDGRVIYHANDRYVLVDLGVRFGTGAVLRPVPAGRPGVFFAVR